MVSRAVVVATGGALLRPIPANEAWSYGKRAREPTSLPAQSGERVCTEVDLRSSRVIYAFLECICQHTSLTLGNYYY